MPKSPPVILAFSGRPGSAAVIASLGARTASPIVTVTLDLGQEGDLEQIAADARLSGAARAHVVDAREAFAAHVILPALRAGAFGAGVDVSVSALARPAVVRALVDVARMEGARIVAHGAAGFDRLAIDLLMADVAPELSVIDASAPAGDLESARITANLWGRTALLPDGVRPNFPDALRYRRTSQPRAGVAHPANVEITFDRGLPVAVNGISMPFVEMVEVVETIAGDHGVGRRDALDAETGAQRITEAPAAVTLALALAELERSTLPPRLLELKHHVARAYASLVDEGAWYSTTRTALDAFVDTAAADVSGIVRVQLFQGECRMDGTTPLSHATVTAGREPA